jgi:hypothetical protein
VPLPAAANREPIPGYVLTERIGAGGYGEVWKSEAPGGLFKAVKLVYGFLNDVRAARELKALNRVKQLRHPFLLSIERIEVVEGQLVIVTELADMCLKDRFEECRRQQMPGIPREELLVYLRDAADALDYMCEHNSLQHLDVKPENLLLVGGRVKVADFGLVKDLHEMTASMMGGMTPLYSAPELFDGRATLQSDQYSLAVVYQEMLTGILPFSGKTPAQLASQHLHSPPRVGVLPPADQPVINRALAKAPEQRFPSCRAMLERLMEATACASANVRTTPPPGTNPVAGAPAQLATEVFGSPTSEQAARAAEAISYSPVPFFDPALRLTGATAGPVTVRVPTAVRHLPPIEIAQGEASSAPTLVIGIGGMAAGVLQRLRRRLADRFGDATTTPAFELLLLDTDPETLSAVQRGESAAALDYRQVLAVPLRTAQQYRAKSAKLLQWLSRRWLYNIPRDLKTQGIRPLGRLALVDHCATVIRRFKESLSNITRPEAMQITSGCTNFHFAATPRVIIVSAISGGTGGGMAIDVAYVAQRALQDLGAATNQVTGILLYATDRHADSHDLTIANGHAFLSELFHFARREGRYPGDPACGMKPCEPGRGPFSDTYFMHLGEELTKERLCAQLDLVAEYVYRDIATTAGTAWRKCRDQARSAEPADDRVSRDDVPLRTFNLAVFDDSEEHTGEVATAELVCEVVRRWLGASGPAKQNEAPQGSPASDDSAAPEQAETAPATPEASAQQATHEERIAAVLQREFPDTADQALAQLIYKWLVAHAAKNYPPPPPPPPNAKPSAVPQPNPAAAQADVAFATFLTRAAGQLTELHGRLAGEAEKLATLGARMVEATAERDDVWQPLRRSIAHFLAAQIPHWISRLEANFLPSYFGSADDEAGSDLAVLCQKLPAELLAAAGRLVERSVADINLPAMLLPKTPSAPSVELLRRLLGAATPKIAAAGGDLRTMLLVPDRSLHENVPALLTKVQNPSPTLVVDADPNVACCCEADNISLAHVAARLVAARPVCVEAASRLHTRSDIVWTTLPQVNSGGADKAAVAAASEELNVTQTTCQPCR